MKKSLKNFLAVLLTLILCMLVPFTVFAQAQPQILGDIDSNGRVTSSDARTILRCAVQLESLSDTAAVRADVNGDGNVTSADARLALRIAVQLDEPLTLPAESETEESTAPPTTNVVIPTLPTTEIPATENPTTEAPTTESPTTEPQGTEDQTTEPPTTEPPVTDEPTTNPPTTEPPAETTTETAVDAGFANIVNSLNSGRYAYSGYMTIQNAEDGDALVEPGRYAAAMAVCGSVASMQAEVDGITLSLVITEDEVYLVSHEKKIYAPARDYLLNMMGMSSADLDVSQYRWDLGAPETAEKTTAELDGRTVDCYTIQETSGICRFYMDSDQLLRIELVDDNGGTVVYEITEFRSDITEEELLPGSDYERMTFFAFALAIMS